jgi:Sec-independent protein translocase protein TatA
MTATLQVERKLPMNFFGIGGTELVVIALIMLIVAGPKRTIRWAYVLGVWVGKARTLWQQAVEALQKEMDEAGVNVQLPKEPPTRQTITRMVSDVVKPYTQELETAYRQTQTQPTVKPSPTAGASVPVEPPAPGLGTWDQPTVLTAAPEPDLGSWSAPKRQEATS